MPRKGKKFDRHEPRPETKYGSALLAKFINCMMHGGKKSIAERIVYGAFDLIEKSAGTDPVKLFHEAIENVKPLLEVRSRRVGGQSYQVPMEVSPKRQLSMAIRWIREAARQKRGRPFHLRLADELVDAYHKEGAAMTQRENVHRMAEANKAFAHFAW